jgi:DME family drug/metabolite transporter
MNGPFPIAPLDAPRGPGKQPREITMRAVLDSAVLSALLSAFLFALSIHLQSLGLERGDARSGALVSIVSATLAYWLLAPFFVESWYWLTGACMLFVIVGIFRPSLSAYLALSSVKTMGPTLTSALTSTAPIFGALYAVTILGEHVSPSIAAGTLAVVAGAVVAAYRPDGVKRGWPLWALALPIGAAFIRASGHALTKLGLAEVPSPFFAGLVGDTVSTIVAGAAFAGQRRSFTGGLAAQRWFAIAGLINGLSLFFLNTALQTGKLSVVVPIVGSTPVFALLLGLLVFRRETFSWRTLATIALIVPGVILVASR